MRRIVTFLLLLISVILFTSNAAQPGIWNAGGSGSFTLLYPEDSTAYKKIQMQSETIYIQLYNGFAVVKGNYSFYNSTVDSISAKVGYPINNVFPQTKFSANLNQVIVDGLYKIKGMVNNKDTPILQSPNIKNDNWYVWNLKFPPQKQLKFSVYFIMNTNNAKITHGYNSDYKNAFIYLIETGSLWKPPIEKGEFFVKFNSDINLNKIRVNSPKETKINYNEKILKLEMENYGLNPDDNLIITYAKKHLDFNFNEIVNNYDSYFKSIDNFSNSNLNIRFTEANFDDVYEIENSFFNNLFLYLLLFLGLIVGIIIFIIKLKK